MNLQTFKAATMAEALTQVKSSMGSDAVILHTRTFHTRAWLGLRRREMVEITAGRGLRAADRRRQPQRPALLAAGAYSRPAAVVRRSSPATGPCENGRQLLETPAATS